MSLMANAQQDTTYQKWEISLTAGISQPFGNYASTSGNGAGFAQLGFASNARVNYEFKPKWSAWVNYNVSTSAVNKTKVSNQSVAVMQAQIANYSQTATIQNATVVASRWVVQDVTAGVGYHHQIIDKLSATYYLGAGVAVVRNPSIINTMYINDLVFETRAKSTNNAALAVNGGVKLAYKVQERTSLFVGAEFYDVFARGVFEYTTVGAQKYITEQVSYKQAIQMLNINFGIATHF